MFYVLPVEIYLLFVSFCITIIRGVCKLYSGEVSMYEKSSFINYQIICQITLFIVCKLTISRGIFSFDFPIKLIIKSKCCFELHLLLKSATRGKRWFSFSFLLCVNVLWMDSFSEENLNIALIQLKGKSSSGGNFKDSLFSIYLKFEGKIVVCN